MGGEGGRERQIDLWLGRFGNMASRSGRSSIQRGSGSGSVQQCSGSSSSGRAATAQRSTSSAEPPQAAAHAALSDADQRVQVLSEALLSEALARFVAALDDAIQQRDADAAAAATSAQWTLLLGFNA
jgi:hypothetical protein